MNRLISGRRMAIRALITLFPAAASVRTLLAQDLDSEGVEDESVGGKLIRKFRKKCDPDKNSYSRRECKEFVDGLSRVQERLINQHFAVDRIKIKRGKTRSETQVAIDAQSSRCYDTPNPDDETITAYNAVGLELWWVRQTIRWCGDGETKVTSFRPRKIDYGISDWNFFWKYIGVDTNASFEGVYKSDHIEYYEAYTKLHFEGCITGSKVGLLCDQSHPWFDQIGTPNGGYTSDAGW
jgi:hypothetical protein